MIPKRIFYVWGAGERKKRDVELCIQSWREKMPDWEIIELNQDNKTYFDYDKEIRENRWFRAIYERKMWAFISDYVRVKTLYDHGGVYLDTDASTVKSMDDLLDNPAFVGLRNKEEKSDYNYAEPAILGAEKGNPLIGKVLNFFRGVGDENIWNTNLFVINHIFKLIMDKQNRITDWPERENQKIIRLPDITVYPEEYFCPLPCAKEFKPEYLTENSRTVHWWGSSWHKPEVIRFMSRKHIVPIERLDREWKMHDKKILYLFGFIRIGSARIRGDKIRAKLFGLPFLKIKTIKAKRRTKTNVMLFGIFNLLKIRSPRI